MTGKVAKEDVDTYVGRWEAGTEGGLMGIGVVLAIN